MVDLGSSVAGQDSFANGVSPDGKVVVGYQEHATGFHPGRAMGGRPAGTVYRSAGPSDAANATNKDGSIMVGRVCSGEDESLQNPNP